MAAGGAISLFAFPLLPSSAKEFVESGQDRVAEWKSNWLSEEASGQPGEGSLTFSVRNQEISERQFGFNTNVDAPKNVSLEQIDASEIPTLVVPEGCASTNSGHGSVGGNLSLSYRITCRDPLLSELITHIEDIKSRVARDRADLPFDIRGIGVSYKTFFGFPIGSGSGLGINVSPNGDTERDEAYHISVYDDEGKSRGRAVVKWTQPELNVETEKFLGPFTLTDNELAAYGEGGGLGENPNLSPFFSVLMNTDEYGDQGLEYERYSPENRNEQLHVDNIVYSEQIIEWIIRNVPIEYEVDFDPTTAPVKLR